jgi:hypothetical protein
MEVTTATIKFSKDEIEQLIKAIVLRLDVGYALGEDKEKESYHKLKDDLLKISKEIIEGEHKNEVNTNRL